MNWVNWGRNAQGRKWPGNGKNWAGTSRRVLGFGPTHSNQNAHTVRNASTQLAVSCANNCQGRFTLICIQQTNHHVCMLVGDRFRLFVEHPCKVIILRPIKTVFLERQGTSRGGRSVCLSVCLSNALACSLMETLTIHVLEKSRDGFYRCASCRGSDVALR